MEMDWLSEFTMMDGMDLIKNQIAIIDQRGYITAVNKTWEDVNIANGCALSTAGTGRNYLDALEKFGEALANDQVRAVLDGLSPYGEYFYPCHTPDEERWFMMTVMPIKKNGQIVGALIQHDNITEMEFYKQETAEILESMTDAFYSIDEHWKFTYINSGAACLLQKNKNDVIGQHILDVLPEMRGTEIVHYYTRVIETQQTALFEYYYPSLSTWFELHVYPRKNGGLSIYFKDIRDRKKAETQLRRAAYFDELTNLPNRRFFIEHLHNMIEKKQKNGRRCAVLFMDLDGFKNINDTLGHDIGDILLQELSVRLRDQAEPDHFVGRLGGDEFLIIYRGAKSDEDILRFANGLLEVVKDPVLIEKSTPLRVTASIGASLYPTDGSTADELMRKADMAMYQAKKLKGNCAVLFHDEIHRHLERRLYIEEHLKNTAENDDIFFVYQPQIDARTNKIIGFEVLSRWNSQKFGWISPVEFIHVAEESGYIADVTKKMIQESFSFFEYLREKCGFDGFISVNLSSRLLTDQLFIEEFKQSVKEAGWPKGSVEIEITESVPLFSSNDVTRNLQMLRQDGICVAIDDFGTGYSALSYLHDFPLDKIKVDKLFVDQIDRSGRGEALLKSILHLANSLDLLVIAEGVETGRQRDWLLKHNCCLIQGYYYYRPLPAEEVMKIFRKK
jgi:diguanylate cyclase (GGDEF)-like protein/PAS domain S-box-containing protein